MSEKKLDGDFTLYEYLSAEPEERIQMLDAFFQEFIHLLSKDNVDPIGFFISVYSDDNTMLSFWQGGIDVTLLNQIVYDLASGEDRRNLRITKWKKPLSSNDLLEGR